MRTFIISSSTAICGELGQRCKVLRLMRNLTQKQLADMTGASLSSVRRFEVQGQGSLELFIKITQALQVVQQLQPLFVQQETSIAEIERHQAATKRQRART